MIPIVDVYRSVQGVAKQSTTGYQTKDKFNDDVELVQLFLIKVLGEQYEKEQVVSDDLAPFVVELPAIPSIKPTDYFRFVSAEINGDEVYPLHRSSVTMTKNSPIRKVSKGFYFQGNQIKFYLGEDSEMETSSMVYIRRPLKASIDIQYSDQGGDYQTPVAVTDMEWPESMRNLIEALLLERLGVETRETISMEFARMGIDREISNYK